VAEKQPISSWATLELYGFSPAARFAQYYEDAYDRGRIQLMQSERYVAPIYELTLIHGERVVAARLQKDDVHIVGTPAEVLACDPAAQPTYGSPMSSR
jgi:hypothetical protein